VQEHIRRHRLGQSALASPGTDGDEQQSWHGLLSAL
jgi:hypothetical protein